MLRQLAVYHAKDPNNLFCVRIAQGLTHLSKGTLTLCPYHADRQIMNPVAVAGLLTFLVSCLDVKNSMYSRCTNSCPVRGLFEWFAIELFVMLSASFDHSVLIKF